MYLAIRPRIGIRRCHPKYFRIHRGVLADNLLVRVKNEARSVVIEVQYMYFDFGCVWNGIRAKRRCLAILLHTYKNLKTHILKWS